MALPDLPAVAGLTESAYVIRPAGADDQPFLTEMLRLAATWRHPSASRLGSDVREAPEIARYVRGWGREGDVGFIAEFPRRRAVGAAWFRLFSQAEPGFGFVDERTPEISIAIVEEARGVGIGTALLRALIEEARSRGLAALSLSVERENPARVLYEREGFVRVGRDDDTWTMRLDLAPRYAASRSSSPARSSW